MQALIIIYSKALCALESSDWRKISRAIKKLASAILLSILFVDLGQNFIWTRAIIEYNDFILIRIFTAFTLIYGYDYIGPLRTLYLTYHRKITAHFSEVEDVEIPSLY